MQYGGSVREYSAKAASLSARNTFLCAGAILIILLTIVPFWNAVALFWDYSYVFWVGKGVPVMMMLGCVGILILYIVTVSVFFNRSLPQFQTEQTVMMIVTAFITLLGLMLILLSLPLATESSRTYNNIVYRCDYSEQTHRLFEYSQVLQNIRATPDCASKSSVEYCLGYSDAYPFTSFLKRLESTFECSGFCYRPTPQTLQQGYLPNLQPPGPPSSAEDEEDGSPLGASNATSDAGAATQDDSPTAVSLLQKSRSVAQKRRSGSSSFALLATESERLEATQLGSARRSASLFSQPMPVSYPPTLYSYANHQISCDSMSARHMKDFAGGVGDQTFYEGVYLVMIALAAGLLKLIGFCVRRERDQLLIDAKSVYRA